LPRFEFSIPSNIDGLEPVRFELNGGDSAFVLGANGSGKSSLMHLFYRTHMEQCVRISAHRQTWFASDSLVLSPQKKRQSEQNLKSTDSNLEARWKDDNAAIRANIAIYELIDAENVRARAIAGAVDKGNVEDAIALSGGDAPIAIINELLELSGLPVTIAIHENERILASKQGSTEYSIAELSDGERNALLIAAAVLTAKPDSLILVDEPERHLHRSIISPLLTHLFARRSDCAFVVSTHEALLPIDNNDSMTLLARGCSYNGKNPTGWEIDIVSGSDGIPEDIKLDIYGARRKLLFVEGTEESLDKPLYGILFPDVTIVPKGNCRDVERSTIGIRSSASLHWASAYGLVDADGRESDIENLAEQGICAINCYSVESLYYHPEMLEFIATRVSNLDGSNPADKVSGAINSAIAAIQPHRDRLCARVATRKLHELVLGLTPRSDDVLAGDNVTLDIPVSDYIEGEFSIFDSAIDEQNYAKLIQRYPLRETPALAQIASQLGFSSRKKYEAAVLKACSDEANIREIVTGWLGVLSEMLSGNHSSTAEQE
jgi:ABC-type Mn2+/Zn2+ transport system ATPase subunit